MDVTEEGTGKRPGRLLKDSKTLKDQTQKRQNKKTKITVEGTRGRLFKDSRTIKKIKHKKDKI